MDVGTTYNQDDGCPFGTIWVVDHEGRKGVARQPSEIIIWVELSGMGPDTAGRDNSVASNETWPTVSNAIIPLHMWLLRLHHVPVVAR